MSTSFKKFCQMFNLSNDHPDDDIINRREYAKYCREYSTYSIYTHKPPNTVTSKESLHNANNKKPPQ